MKTKTTERAVPLTDIDRQTMPLPGEVDPSDAHRVARHLVAVAKLKMSPGASTPTLSNKAKPRSK